MSGGEACDLPLQEASRLLRRRDLSSRELTRSCLERTTAAEPELGAFIRVTPDEAMAQAEEADRRIAAGRAGPLTGIPLQLKDNLATRGVATTCGSRMLESFVPPYDATVVERLRRAGVVMVGKGNMDEFAMGSSTENSAFFPTRNPRDPGRVPGGSSGGPAAAVAAGEALGALGSDTGGSIRQPAALCGIVGVKPTYGLVSRYGLVAFGSSLDQIGPLGRRVADCAMLLQAIAGHDVRDSTSARYDPPDYLAELRGGVRGLRFGVPRELSGDGIAAGVRGAVEEALGALEGLGATVDRDLSLPSTRHALAVYYIIAPSEASANLARYDGVKYGFAATGGHGALEAMERTRQAGFGPEVKRRLMLGTYALSAGYYDAYYLRAQRARTLMRRELEEAFRRYDAILTPTSPTPAFRLGERTADPVQMYLSDVCTIPANLAGICAVSVPCGDAGGMPVGLQVLGPPFGEATALRVARVVEWARGDRDRQGSVSYNDYE